MISFANSLHLGDGNESDRVVVEAFGLSDRGLVRRANEDHFLIADMERSVLIADSNLPANEVEPFADLHSQLFLVADGAGGSAGGSHASRLAAEVMIRHVAARVPDAFPLDRVRAEDIEQQMYAAMAHCQAEIESTSRSAPELSHMATTLTAAHLLWPKLCVAHVGDSRCYLLRGGALRQLTTDHTLAQQRVEAGELPQDAALGHRDSRVLYNALARGVELDPQILTIELRAHDAVLLCTDGLPRHVNDDRVKAAMLAATNVEQACEWLIRAANAGGGTDNVTAIVVRVPPATPPVDPDHMHAAATRPSPGIVP